MEKANLKFYKNGELLFETKDRPFNLGDSLHINGVSHRIIQKKVDIVNPDEITFEIDEWDPEIEKFINSLKNGEIYRYMRNQYDKLTKEGALYHSDKVEEFDDKVADIASKEYKITKEEACKIYEEIEMKIAEFRQVKK